jgi:hypothetical protein
MPWNVLTDVAGENASVDVKSPARRETDYDRQRFTAIKVVCLGSKAAARGAEDCERKHKATQEHDSPLAKLCRHHSKIQAWAE